MRVLLVSHCADVYGSERWNAQLVRGLQSKGHQVAIAQPTAHNELTREIAALGVHQYWTTPIPIEEPWRAFVPDGPNSAPHTEARAFICDAHPDVIVFSDGEPGSNLPAKEVARDFAIPSICVSHLGADVLAQEHMFPPAIRARIAQALARAVAVVGVSRANIASLVAAFPLDSARLHVIPYGRPPRYFASIDPSARSASRATLGVSDDQVLFLTVARVHPNKRYSIQVDALRRLRQHPVFPRIRCAWIGGGEGLDQLAKVLRLHGLSSTVTLCGYVSDPLPLFAAADAFVLPSAREGAPLAVVEAMGAGLPVIATDVGGIADLLGDTGIVLPDPNESQAATVLALQDSIVRVASDAALRQRLGAAARKSAIARFGEDVMIDRYADLVGSALKP